MSYIYPLPEQYRSDVAAAWASICDEYGLSNLPATLLDFITASYNDYIEDRLLYYITCGGKMPMVHYPTLIERIWDYFTARDRETGYLLTRLQSLIRNENIFAIMVTNSVNFESSTRTAELCKALSHAISHMFEVAMLAADPLESLSLPVEVHKCAANPSYDFMVSINYISFTEVRNGRRL